MDETSLRDTIRDILEGQESGVFITQGSMFPYPSVVAFQATSDISTIYFMTSMNSQKHENLLENPHVAFLVDNRLNVPVDTANAVVVTAFGIAGVETDSSKVNAYKAGLEGRYPTLVGFFNDKATALVVINVEDYQVVSNFQEVHEIKI